MKILRQFEKHSRWPEVLEVLNTLKAGGYQALLVGGAVRDVLLGRSIKDFDVVTNAIPNEVERLFPRSIAVGKAFGVIAIPFESGFQIEVATFRADGEYDEGRHPKRVIFSNMEEDGARRDFTINALYFDPFSEDIKDLFEGFEDLKSKTIRAIGKPEHRFFEDPLRLLRAVRFASQLGFSIHPDTWLALVEESNQIRRVSRERIGIELKLLFASPNWWEGLCALEQSQLWQAIFAYPAKGLERLEDLKKSKAGWLERMIWSGADFSQLKYSNQELKTADFLKRNAPLMCDSHMRMGESLEILNKAPLPEFLNYLSGWAQLNELNLDHFEEVRREFLKVATPEGHLPQPLLTGNDLLKLGVLPGMEMGKWLREVYLLQIEGAIGSLEQAKDYIQQKRR